MKTRFAGMGLSVDKPARLILLHPTTRQPLRDAEGKEAWVDLYSSDSGIARNHNLSIQRRRLRGMRGRLRIEPEELEAENVDLLAALTAGWYLLNLDGSPVNEPFSPDAARELYGDPANNWVRDQVDEFVTDRGNYSPASSTT